MSRFSRLKVFGVLAAAALAALPAASFATYTAPTEIVSFTDTSAMVTASTSTWLLPGLAITVGIGAVIWLVHRTTGKFTDRRA